MSDELAGLLAKRFIQNRGMKAVQKADGGYRPADKDRNFAANPGWTMGDLRRHIAGEQTFGHYVCDSDGLVKVFTLDVDLRWYDVDHGETLGRMVTYPDMTEIPVEEWEDHAIWNEIQPRTVWQHRTDPTMREYLKFQLRYMADILTECVQSLGIGTAAAYSGCKGVHVYGFTGTIPAADARALALDVLEIAAKRIEPTGEFEAIKGDSFFRHKFDWESEYDRWTRGFPHLDVEVYPKQKSMDGKLLGNLVRLPGGVNRKSARTTSKGVVYDPAFFIDQKLGTEHLAPHPNPVRLLESGDPWE